jgi:AAA domain
MSANDEPPRIADIANYQRKLRFRPVRFRDIKLQTTSYYLIKGLIPREGLIVIWGPPKCGKSFWTFDLAMHVALGWEYRGRRVEAGTVVYIACEGERGLAARAEAFRVVLMSEEADPPFFLLATRLDLVADIDELLADVRTKVGSDQCAAIIIDTLNRSISGSENKDDDMGAYVKTADRLREELRCAVLIIHHCGINGDRPRGHTSLAGAADAQISIRRDGTGCVLAKLEWMKDGPEGDEILSRLRAVEVGVDDDGEPISSCVIEAATADETPHARPRRLSPQEGRALQLLNEAISTAGEVPQPNPHIPPNTRCIPQTLWREYCDNGSISTGKKDAKRMAFNRSAPALLAKELIGKWGELVWLR